MLKEEVIIKILGKTTLECPEVDQHVLRGILEEVLYNYEVQVACTALVVANDIQDKLILYLATKKLDGLSDLTIYNYKLHLVRFSNFMRKNIEDINAMDIRMYLATLSKETGIKNTSLATEISILKSFFNWLETEDYIVKSPMKKIKQTKVPKMLRNSLSVEELERLRDSCKTLRQRAIVEFLFSTGCRLSEVTHININDLNWGNYSLKVIGKGSKEREVYFSPKAKLYLQKYLNSRKDNTPALFVTERKPHTRLGNRAIQKEIKTIASNAGFDKSIFPHLLRHTFATLALRSGAPLTAIQKLMGHSDPATTELYAHINQDTIQEEYKKHFIQ